VQITGGSFFDDPLPGGADVVTLVRVLHDHDDTGALQLLRAVHAALPAGGMLVVAEPMSETAGAKAMGDAYFGFYLLAMGRGRPRSAERISELLREVGFVAVRQRATAMPLQVSLITALRPSAKTPVPQA
jgi:demethylspheroidene O-methyltransferase